MIPVEFITTGVSAIIVPTIAWVITQSMAVSRKVNLLDSQFNESMKDLDRMVESISLHATRISKLEEICIGLERMLQKNEANFGVILTKLDTLPRITAILENYGSAIGQVVPRSEVEARLKSLEDQIKTMNDRSHR